MPHITAQPSPASLLEWHFVLEGTPGSEFEGGVYHGKLVFPPQYPFKPPSISLFTPNGRFAVNTKLCLSMTDYHPESWNPMWCVPRGGRKGAGGRQRGAGRPPCCLRLGLYAVEACGGRLRGWLGCVAGSVLAHLARGTTLAATCNAPRLGMGKRVLAQPSTGRAITIPAGHAGCCMLGRL